MRIPFLSYDIEIRVYKNVHTEEQKTRKDKDRSPIRDEFHSSNYGKSQSDECKLQNKIPSVLVLLIKADDASTLVDNIKQKGKLYEGAETALFVNTMKMWVGNISQYNKSTIKKDFSRSECSDSFVKEYDYYAIRFELNKEYKGYNKNDDSYERNEFFSHICKDEIKLIECSNRLSFDTSSTTEAYDVY